MNASAVLAAPTLQNPAAQLAYTPPGLIVASRDVLLQGRSLHFKLSDSTSSQFVESYDASIGTHYRQVVRHFECVIRSVRSGEVNYDTREAHPRLGTEVTYAAIATCDVLRALRITITQPYVGLVEFWAPRWRSWHNRPSSVPMWVANSLIA